MEEGIGAQVQEFIRRGFCVIPSALSPAELRSLQEAFDDDRARWPQCWELRGQSQDKAEHWSSFGGEVGERGRWQTEPLPRTDAFDRCIWHPKIFPLLCRLMGKATLRLNHMSAMSRDPVLEEPHPEMGGYHYQMWHREQGGSFAPDHEFCMSVCMVMYYLDDCTGIFCLVSSSRVCV